MFEKLVPDALREPQDINHSWLAAVETVTIQPGQVQTVHTGFRSYVPLLVSFIQGLGKLDMCVLLTTSLIDGDEVKVAVLNRGSDPVEIKVGEWLLHVCELPLWEPED